MLVISQLSNSLKIKFFDNKYFMMLQKKQKKLKMISLFRVFRQIIAFIVSREAIP